MDKEFGLTNEGTDGVVKVPAELKDHSKDPTLVSESVKTGLEEAKAGNLLDSPEDFSKFVEKKKRGRPKKVVEEVKPLRQFRCSTCREVISEQAIMKIGAGNDGRYAAFCPFCQRSLGFVDDVMQQKVQDLIKNNPTGK